MDERTQGWINLYKPIGISSFSAIYKIRKKFNIKKLGHAGTLDPNAEGILPIAINKTLHNKRTALVTGPLNKEMIISIDKKFTGHTEYIQKITKSDGVLMMLASEQLRVALATTHIPIKNVAKTITKELIINKVKILNNDLKTKFNIKDPNIKILGLNPHAGENGNIGTEELLHIKPALKDLRRKKINVSIPLSADTAFSKKTYS